MSIFTIGMKFKFSPEYIVANKEFVEQYDINSDKLYSVHEIKKIEGFEDDEGKETGATYGVTKVMLHEGEDISILDIATDKTSVWCFIISDYPEEYIVQGDQDDPADPEGK